MLPTVVVIATSPRQESVSAAAVKATALLRSANVLVICASQRELPFVPAVLHADAYPTELGDLIGSVSRADGIILMVPTHRSAVAGGTRNLLEHLRDALPGKVVLSVIAAGSQRSTLAAQASRPISS